MCRSLCVWEPDAAAAGECRLLCSQGCSSLLVPQALLNLSVSNPFLHPVSGPCRLFRDVFIFI